MKQSQLERIRRKIREIRQIIEEDTVASIWISEKLTEFSELVASDLKGMVWGEYEEKWEQEEEMKSAET